MEHNEDPDFVQEAFLDESGVRSNEKRNELDVDSESYVFQS